MFASAPVDGKYLNCGNSKGALTHSTRLSVNTVTFEWEPPASLSGNISFFATVVKDTATFWVKLQSTELYKREMQPTQSTQSSATTEQTQGSTTQPSVASTHQETSSKSTDTTMSTAATTNTGNTSTTMSAMSTATTTHMANNTCKPNDSKCDGIQLNHNALFLFFVGLILLFWQNVM
ncbi:Hypothetical predicted protein [Paramuricea clavata]|uniref:Uncharacterized protein n=1 Tax=Paramuricea clavata TaxID=317549 RepID=A0A6S7I469_PARCT|nr:Hypothetical predicted protein [Paramuricea clavata]